MEETWRGFLKFESRVAAEVVAALLEAEDVPTAIAPGGLFAVIESAFVLSVPERLAHRARWVLANSEFSDAELNYLATGELPKR